MSDGARGLPSRGRPPPPRQLSRRAQASPRCATGTTEGPDVRDTSSPRLGRQRDGTALVALVWSLATLPSAVQLLVTQRGAIDVATERPLTGAAAAVGAGLTLATAVWCVVTITGRVGRIETRIPLRFAAYFAPWAYLVTLTLVDSGGLEPRYLLFPLIGLAFWARPPSRADIRLLGLLTVASASASLLLGWATSLGTVSSYGYEQKALIGSDLLAGLYSHPNALGACMALGVPAILMLQRFSSRLIGLATVVGCTVWSGSRTALAAIAIVLVLAMIRRNLSLSWGASLQTAVAAASLVVVMILPFIADSASDFSGRGAIWAVSLDFWRESPLLGNGVGFYQAMSTYATGLGKLAFHGHNLVVHMLTIGGVAGAAAVGSFLIVAIHQARRHGLHGEHLGFDLLLVIFVLSALEVVTDFVNPSTTGLIAWLGLCWLYFSESLDEVKSAAR